MSNLVGRKLDTYRLIQFLGGGTFGDVYLAKHIWDGTQVAIKVLKFHVTPQSLQAFLKEARTFRLQHPHIVQLRDFGIDDERPFIVMHYAPHGTVRTRYPPGTRLPLTTIITYVKQVADALQYAHERRIVHRDVKPQNMLLDANDEILLGDFGVAVIAHTESSMSTQEGMAGTSYYIAPEQIQGKPVPASDQYALGVCIYEWLSGERPFCGSVWEILSQHVTKAPPPLRDKLPILPVTVEEVVLKALSKKPPERFESIQAFSQAFETACQEYPHLGTDLEKFNIRSTDDGKDLRGEIPQEEPAERRIRHQETQTSDIVGSVTPSTWPHAQENDAHTIAMEEEYSQEMTRSALFTSQLWRLKEIHATRQQKTVQTLETVATLSRVKLWLAYRDRLSQRRLVQLGLISLLLITLSLTGSMLFNLLGLHGSIATIIPGHSPRQTVSPSTTTSSMYDLVTKVQPVMSGYNAQHTHWNRYEQAINRNNVTRLKLLWKYSPIGTMETPDVANGITYISSADNTLYAFDGHCHQNCQPLWNYTAIRPITPPAIANSNIYIGSDDGTLYVFATSCRRDCQPLWNYNLGERSSIYSAPTIADGIVYVSSVNQRIYAFDTHCKQTCQPIWSYITSGVNVAPPTVADGLLFIAASNDTLYVFNAQCPQKICLPLWSYVIAGGIAQAPTVSNGIVYINSLANRLYAFDATCQQNCLPLWSYNFNGNISAPPAVTNSLLYIGTDDNKLYAFDATCRKNCLPLWSYATGGPILTSPTIANGLVFVSSNDNHVYAFDSSCLENCQPLWIYAFQAGGLTSPLVADGLLYISSYDEHKLFVFGPGDLYSATN